MRKLIFFVYAKSKSLAIFSDCAARFVSDLVGNPEDRFSHNEVHIILTLDQPVLAALPCQFE